MDSIPLNGLALVIAWIALTILPQSGWARSIERDRACLACHDEMEAKPILSVYQTRHGMKGDPRTPDCQDCHGESQAHGKDKKVVGKRPLTDIPFPPGTQLTDARAARARDAPCLKCHENNVGRHWSGSGHEMRGLACVSCHTLHSARDKLLDRAGEADTCFRCHPNTRAEIHRAASHPLSVGKLACRDCHDAHGGEGPSLTRDITINDTCYACHADKRGPFLWEHAPVGDNCLSCHVPHGGNHAALLKAREPWLCQQCHSSARHPSMAYSGAQIPGGGGPLVAHIPLRGCANCHARVHGSNHPSGARLLR